MTELTHQVESLVKKVRNLSDTIIESQRKTDRVLKANAEHLQARERAFEEEKEAHLKEIKEQKELLEKEKVSNCSLIIYIISSLIPSVVFYLNRRKC